MPFSQDCILYFPWLSESEALGYYSKWIWMLIMSFKIVPFFICVSVLKRRKDWHLLACLLVVISWIFNILFFIFFLLFVRDQLILHFFLFLLFLFINYLYSRIKAECIKFHLFITFIWYFSWSTYFIQKISTLEEVKSISCSFDQKQNLLVA